MYILHGLENEVWESKIIPKKITHVFILIGTLCTYKLIDSVRVLPGLSNSDLSLKMGLLFSNETAAIYVLKVCP